MRADLAPGNPFPDLRLPETTGKELTLSGIARGQPLVLLFVRGWWCPKEQVRVRNVVAMQDEITREYGALAAVTVDEPYVNGAFRAGIGASFPFLSDTDRAVARALDILEVTDEKHVPFLPLTFVCDSQLVIRQMWNGFWFWGNPTPDELRLALREITRDEQPTYDPVPVWAGTGSSAPDAGIDAPAVWVREDSAGHELQRGVWSGDELPEVGERTTRSPVDGRWWRVVEVERAGDRVAIHLRKEGEPDGDPRLVRHRMAVPRG
jgi:peroxiredoxin